MSLTKNSPTFLAHTSGGTIQLQLNVCLSPDVRMIELRENPANEEIQILARSNFSLSSSGLLGVITALGALTLALATFVAWQGYWPVLLVALLQLLLVGWILIRAWKKAWIVERIDIGPTGITVTRRQYHGEQQYHLDPHWAQVRMERPEIHWYPDKLLMRSRDVTVELGGFLTDKDKKQLAKDLNKAIAQYVVWQKHKIYS